MNITNVNQNLSVQGTKDNEVRKTQTAGFGKNNIGITVEKKENVVSGEERAAGICCTVVETDVTALSDIFLQEESDLAKNQEALIYTANHMTEEDYEELSAEGYSIEEYEAGRLERALERRKENQEFRAEAVSQQIDNKEEFREEIEKISISNKISDPLAKKAAQKLADADLPVTEENIEAMLGAFTLSGVMGKLSENGMAVLIGKELPITLENLYNSQYSSVKVQAPGEEAWKAVENQAGAILTEAGIETTQSNMEKAKWLFDHNLPISENTMDIYNSLQVLQNGLDEEVLFEKMAEAMKQGMAPEQADLNVVLQDKLCQAVEDFGELTQEAVTRVVENGERLNLVNLKYAQQQIAEEKAEGQRNTDVKAVKQENAETKIGDQGSLISEITAYRQLEEIRLKLTLESAQTLAKNGIRIDTSELQRIVEGLKDLEEQYYEKLLEEGNAQKTEANVALLKETTETFTNIRNVPAAVLGVTLKVNTAQSMDSLYEAGTDLKAAYDKAGEAYETLMTAPRKDMGDSIQKAFRNVDAILEELNMQPTEDNRRAVRILGYNRMEITESSVAAVRAYDSQVTSLVNELHPAATVELIKRGINPLDTPMEQLLAEVKQIKEELGAADEEKYSTYLWKLEKQNGISEEERKSYIGIYRLLNNLEKTDGAAIGAVLDTGKELTMGNLLTAVRTLRHKGMNVEVNDAFGALKELTFTRETITEQIEAGFTGASKKMQNTSQTASSDKTVRQNEQIYQENILQEILENISPDKLSQALNSGLESRAESDNSMADKLDRFMNMSLEQLKEELHTAEGEEGLRHTYLKEKVEDIRHIIREGDAALEFLDQYHQPVSIENLAVVSEYFTGEKNVFKELKQYADKVLDGRTGSRAVERREELGRLLEEMAEAVDNPETLQQKFDELGQKSEEILNDGYADMAISGKELKNLRLLGKGIMLTGSMSRQEHYEIPIVTGDSITNVSLTIRKGTGEKGKLQISMDSEKFGRIEMEASIKEQAINGIILCESTEGFEKLNDCRQQMTDALENIGLTVKQLSAAVSDKALERLRSRGEAGSQTDTAMLYRAAKVLIEELRAVEAE